MKYVIGVDLGTSAVKVLLVDQNGNVCEEISESYPVIQEKSGYSEQDPELWVEKTSNALAGLMDRFDGNAEDIEGISFSGQMHGLVLLDEENTPLRNAILWNDTRTTVQCRQIVEKVGKERLLAITKNPALEGFTLPKLLWVKEHEPDLFDQVKVFMLPKDYLRYRLTGNISSDYSDAAGTLLLNVTEKKWSKEIAELVGISSIDYPPLVESHTCIGTLTSEFAQKTGLEASTKVFAGGADNACGAIGAGILSDGKTLCSIGTSGVILSYEEVKDRALGGNVHFFNHGEENSYYTMGVTLSAGHSLSWFKDTFAENDEFETLLKDIDKVPPGSRGLVFTPYLAGERTPHADAVIRGSFIGLDASHTKRELVRAVVEGITFSLNESIEIFRDAGKRIDTIVSIGGGAKSEAWLQIQADIFNATIVKLSSEQGPGMGAAMLAAYGCGWFSTLDQCSAAFLDVKKTYHPVEENVRIYQELFNIYKEVYHHTKGINEKLKMFRN